MFPESIAIQPREGLVTMQYNGCPIKLTYRISAVYVFHVICASEYACISAIPLFVATPVSVPSICLFSHTKLIAD